MAALTAKSDKVLRRLTGATLIVVGLAGAIQSYTYLTELAISVGVSSSLSFLFPISIDGLIVAGSLSLLRSSLQGRRDLFGWLLVVLGSFISIWGNIVAANGGFVASAVHTIPVVAMIASLECFLSALRHGYVQKATEAEQAQKEHEEAQRVHIAEEAQRARAVAREQARLERLSAKAPAKTSPAPVKVKPVVIPLVQEHKVEFVEEVTESHHSLQNAEVVQEDKEISLVLEQPSVAHSMAVVEVPIQRDHSPSPVEVYENSISELDDSESLTRKTVVILLAHEEHFSGSVAAADVAQVLDISVLQARKAIERARNSLRKEQITSGN